MFQYAFRLNHKNNEDKVFWDINRINLLKIHNSFELEKIFEIKDDKLTKMAKFKILGPYFYFRDKEFNFFRIVNKFFRKQNKVIFKRYVDDNSVLLEKNFNKRYLDYLKNYNKNIYFFGTFQSYKYFDHMRYEVLKTFTFLFLKELYSKTLPNRQLWSFLMLQR